MRPAFNTGTEDPTSQAALGADIRYDLKRKQELFATACRCLDDELTYRFFNTLATLGQMDPDVKAEFLNFLETTGDYDAEELAAIRRLVMGEGAVAFKELLDLVWEIRVQQEIEAMVR